MDFYAFYFKSSLNVISDWLIDWVVWALSSVFFLDIFASVTLCWVDVYNDFREHELTALFSKISEAETQLMFY